MLSLFRKARDGPSKEPPQKPVQHGRLSITHSSRPNAYNHALKLYEYLPLESVQAVRLLTVLPSEQETAAIQCKLTVDDLVLAAPYETLSYAWGFVHSDGSHLTHAIQCGDQYIRVTKHLYHFLLHFRAHQKGYQVNRKLWVDAICINQANDDEKTEQVQLMADIYRQAARLNIWLGEAEADRHDLRLDGDRYANPVENDRSRQTLDWIRRNVYFTRRWIVQELGLSPAASATVWLGGKQYRWSALRRTIGLEVKNMDHDFIIYHRPEQELTLLENLGFCQYAECSEPRDLIFALLSISSDGARHTINYSATMEQVLLNAAKTSIRYTSQLINVLVYALTHPAPAEASLPTWVPDWRQPPVDTVLRGNVSKDLLRQNGAGPGWFERVECTEYGRYAVDMSDRVHDDRLLLNGWLLQDCTTRSPCDKRYAEDTCAYCAVKRSVAQIDALYLQIDFALAANESFCLLSGSQVAFVVQQSPDYGLREHVYRLRRVVRVGTNWMRLRSSDEGYLDDPTDFWLG